MADGLNVQSVAQHRFPMSSAQSETDNKWSRYLGPPTGEIKPSAYDKIARTNVDLPDNYLGKSLYMRDTIDGFILEDNRWYTTICLPWGHSDQLTISWNVWNFNTVLADRVPHEGISRLITSDRQSYKASVVRRGLAFVMEADHMGTPEGDIQYQRNVTGITQSVQGN